MSKKNATKVKEGPCFAEAEESRKCMELSNGVKSKCVDKFLAYKDCKTKIYVSKQKERDDVFFGKK